MTIDRYYAHTGDKPTTEWDLLLDHLQKTAALAGEFGGGHTGAGARLAGLLHDLGKYQERFQLYLRREIPKGPAHAMVGAQYASKQGRSALMPLILAIAGHHGELKDWADVEAEYFGFSPRRNEELDECVGVPEVKPLLSAFDGLKIPAKHDAALYTRFLYSALVDADSLLTEEWDLGQARSSCPLGPKDLLPMLERHLRELNADGNMNELRRTVQDACRVSAANSSGSFRLTVPTGGGKTLASLLFALRHAVQHGKRRVFTVIPYTSIIDQTAKAYRDIFGGDAVLEHHSNLDASGDEPLDRRRTENWDSPLVVTTSVRFFETLFANRKRLLRRLHRVADSVVILDEVQTFPLHLRAVMNSALNRLVKEFGVTVVHCSATQPLLVQPDATEIAPNPPALFAATRSRIEATLPTDWSGPETWAGLAQKMQDEPSRQVLAIVNRRKDALELAKLVGDDCIHLSTWMCAAHRRALIAEIKERLEKGRPCLVVSTQLIEAGVDIDFPVVYRAFCGLDSLIQSAGRCNREGTRQQLGRFIAFVPPEDPPKGILREGFGVAKQMVINGELTGKNMDSPSVVETYFSRMRSIAPGVLGQQILSHERVCNFPKAAEFHMIEDHGEMTAIAPHGDWLRLVNEARETRGRDAIRALQPYSVNLSKGLFHSLRDNFEPLWPESEIWVPFPVCATSVYSGRFGFGAQGPMAILID